MSMPILGMSVVTRDDGEEWSAPPRMKSALLLMVCDLGENLSFVLMLMGAFLLMLLDSSLGWWMGTKEADEAAATERASQRMLS